jgi:NhaP-type Na+/H+ or K+/H+ antiporter
MSTITVRAAIMYPTGERGADPDAIFPGSWLLILFLPGSKSHAMLVITFFVVLLTVLFNGGAATHLMAVLKLRRVDEQQK